MVLYTTVVVYMMVLHNMVLYSMVLYTSLYKWYCTLW